jgi:hypothetical protein
MMATMTPHQKSRLVLIGSGGGNDDTPSKNPLGIDWEWW